MSDNLCNNSNTETNIELSSKNIYERNNTNVSFDSTVENKNNVEVNDNIRRSSRIRKAPQKLNL